MDIAQSSKATEVVSVAAAGKNLPIIISIFNQKGGVGKTTATYELGYVLSHYLGLKVLMIDADPQASLTAYINPGNSDNPEQAEKFKQMLEEKKAKSIFCSIEDIFEPALIKNRETVVPADRAKNVEILPVKEYKNFFYLPGGIKFSLLGNVISLGLNNIPGTQGFVNMVPNLFKEIGRLNGIDIILADLNPGIDGINQSIIMNSDYVLIPYKPSLGCLDSVKNLTQIFPKWFEDMRTRGHLAPDQGPVLLGTFAQIMRTRNEQQNVLLPSGKAIKKSTEFVEAAYDTWIQKIIEKTLALQKIFLQYMPDKQKNIPLTSFYGIGVRDMIGAVLEAQNSGYPMSDLNYKHKQIKNKKDGTTGQFNFKKAWKIVKEKTNASYRKIWGVFLQYLTPEHRSELALRAPGFEQTINLYSSLTMELGSSSSGPVVAPPIAPSNIKLDEHWFTDAEITSIGENILAGKKPLFYMTTPMQGDGAFASSNQLSTNVKEYFLNHIADSEKHMPASCTIFIPLNMGALTINPKSSGNHWTLAIVRYINSDVQLFYFDPLDDQIGAAAGQQIMAAVQDVFNISTNLHFDRLEGVGRVQNDWFNCGPWVLKAMEHMANNEAMHLLSETNIAVHRQRFMEIIHAAEVAEETTPGKKRRKKRNDNVRRTQIPQLVLTDEATVEASSREETTLTTPTHSRSEQEVPILHQSKRHATTASKLAEVVVVAPASSTAPIEEISSLGKRTRLHN